MYINLSALLVPPDETCMLEWAYHWFNVPDDTPIAETGRILLPACLSLCQQRSDCKSVAFSFSNDDNNCRLYNTTRYDIPLLDSAIYSYYEHYSKCLGKFNFIIILSPPSIMCDKYAYAISCTFL